MNNLRGNQVAILLVPLFAAAGGYLLPVSVGGVVLFGYRMLILILFAYLLLTGRLFGKNQSNTGKFFVFLGFAWITWGACSAVWSSLMWGANLADGFREVTDVGFGLSSCFILSRMVRGTREGSDALRVGWVLAFVFTGVIAIWELNSGNHLPGYAAENFDLTELSVIVYSTLGNPNNYAAFLALSCPFLLWSARVSSGFPKAVYILLFCTLPILMALTAGRLGLLALILEILLFSVLQVIGPRRNWRMLMVSVGLILSLILTAAWYETTAIKVAGLLDELGNGGSASIRVNLARDGLHFIWVSYGLGIGPGNFEHLMSTGQVPYGAEGLVNPHNFWIEVASQYGLVIVALFLVWLGLVAASAWHARRLALVHSAQSLRCASEAVLIGLVGYLLVAAENSSYISQSTNWLFIGSLLGLTDWFDCRGYQIQKRRLMWPPRAKLQS